MRFIYARNAGQSEIILDSKQYHHIFNVRRLKAKMGDIFHFANLADSTLYRYKLVESKKAKFILLDSTLCLQPQLKTHIIQAVISDFDKILPFLNELFVGKISLFYADFSQRNIKINTERLEAILINSSMQCGRLSKMEIEIFESLDAVLQVYKDSVVALDFCDEVLDLSAFRSVIVGGEGGFSQREREILREIRISGINHPLILRSQTASVFVASKFVAK